MSVSTRPVADAGLGANGSSSNTIDVAIVGAGVGGLIALVCVRYAGTPNLTVRVFDARGFTMEAWTQHTGAIGQARMRSESEGHFFPTDFPGFALVDSLQNLSPMPLVRSTFNRYNPRLADVGRHAAGLARHVDMAGSTYLSNIETIERVGTSDAHLVLHDAEGSVWHARHVLLALGHGQPRWPEACQSREQREQLAGVLYHSYESKPYDGRSTIVIGSGIAAMTEWINVLRHGGSVISVRRRPDITTLPLSAPRCAFAGPWLDRYHSSDSETRSTILRDISRGTIPRDRSWKRMLRHAEREGRFTMMVGEITTIQRSSGGVDVSLTPQGRQAVTTVHAGMVISATGFNNGWQEHAVLRDLVRKYSLATCGNRIILSDDCTIPGLSLPNSVISVCGPLASWAFPAADSFAGMKYAARRFAGYASGTDRVGLHPIRLAKMIQGGWPREAPPRA